MRRLAIIRYLYNTAIEQSRRPEPLGLLSILTFHDSVELFLQLIAEQLNVSKSGMGFMDYWGAIEPKLGKELSDKESLRRLNTARVDFKHYGILPSRLEIEGFRASVTNFFEVNTPLVFGSEFRSISVLELVQCIDARSTLREAQKLLEQRKMEEALEKIAIAFSQLVDDYEHRKMDQFGQSPFFFGESTAFWGSSFRKFRDLEDFASRVGRSIEEIQDALKLLSLGLDYRRYAKFRLLTPYVRGRFDGKYDVQWQTGHDDTPYYVNDDCRFCFDFVIEAALHLQEFDFNAFP